MTIRAYESLIENPPDKKFVGSKVGYLLPYFRREKSLQEISVETDIPESKLLNWLRNDLAVLATAFVEHEQAFSEAPEQINSLAVSEGSSELTVDKLLLIAARYQEVFLGYTKSDQLSDELGLDIAVVRLHMDSLYGKVLGAYRAKSDILTQLLTLKGGAGGGHHE